MGHMVPFGGKHRPFPSKFDLVPFDRYDMIVALVSRCKGFVQVNLQGHQLIERNYALDGSFMLPSPPRTS